MGVQSGRLLEDEGRTMNERILAKVREWYILGTALIFIIIIGVVGAYYPAATSATSTAVESAAQSPQRAGSDAPQAQTTERSASNRRTPAGVTARAP